MRHLIVLLGALAVVSCATTAKDLAKFTAANDQFIGKNADELVLAKGPPVRTFTLSSGSQVFDYSSSHVETRGGGSYTQTRQVNERNKDGTWTWKTVPTEKSVPIRSEEKTCKLLFIVSQSNRVESWSHEGNGCF